MSDYHKEANNILEIIEATLKDYLDEVETIKSTEILYENGEFCKYNRDCFRKALTLLNESKTWI